ncbi:SMP-30/gluconolactonase/LRE family protein [Geothrix sp. 21YS21S-4]|uniref:SMP-30/gluconolactonase/LRE family protein n=1 Tax=Geothrix sp. 21YS21S-4 TaxID=3068889 RepID=UPI0027B99EF7|nr:SMP-30/gluconolactonase/LRE family protein [Geothrix sp. 21YS21S-4]
MSLESVGPQGISGRWRFAVRSGALVSGLFLSAAFVALGTGCSKGKSSPYESSAPVIKTQPVDTSVISGRSVSLSVVADGAVTLSYQWTKGGQNIVGGRSATLTLSSPTAQDSGSYAVTVTNSLGSITSTPVALTVVAAVDLTAPMGVVADASGNIFVSDSEDHVIWKVDATNRKTLLAGNKGVAGSADGVGAAALFRNPAGLALDSAGNVVVADAGNHTIRRIAPNGTVTTLAGTAGAAGTADGIGSLARFNTPSGVAVDSTGLIYVADTQNHTLRKLAANGTVTTFAGTAGTPGLLDATGAAARLNQPSGLALKADGTLVVADYGNSCIRTVASGAQVTTLAGQTTHGFSDARGTSAQFYWPVAVAVDGAGAVWVADTHNHAIRRVLADGSLSTPAGSGGNSGNADGSGTAALFNLPCGIAVTPAGNLVVADTYNHYLRGVTPAGVVTTYTAP